MICSECHRANDPHRVPSGQVSAHDRWLVHSDYQNQRLVLLE